MTDQPMEEITHGDTTWRFDVDFLQSRWTCLFGKGCLGILAEPSEHLGQGCCSVGAQLDGDDEARMISALGATLDPERFQHHAVAARDGVFTDNTHSATAVVDGACIFLNHPGFAGGAGCALHLAALDADESPIEWKPSVCWQLPIKVDWEPGPRNSEVATVRRWTRADWGADGEPMAWCCTEGERAYGGEHTVLDSLGDEIEAIVGTAVHVELRRRLTP